MQLVWPSECQSQRCWGSEEDNLRQNEANCGNQQVYNQQSLQENRTQNKREQAYGRNREQ